MSGETPAELVQRIENAIGIVGLRVRPHGMDLMPQVSSVALVKMVVLDAAELLNQLLAEEAARG